MITRSQVCFCSIFYKDSQSLFVLLRQKFARLKKTEQIFYTNRSVSEVWYIIKGACAFVYHHGQRRAYYRLNRFYKEPSDGGRYVRSEKEFLAVRGEKFFYSEYKDCFVLFIML